MLLRFINQKNEKFSELFLHTNRYAIFRQACFLFIVYIGVIIRLTYITVNKNWKFHSEIEAQI